VPDLPKCNYCVKSGSVCDQKRRRTGRGPIGTLLRKFLEGLRATTKNISRNSRYSGRDSNRTPSEYKPEASPCSVLEVGYRNSNHLLLWWTIWHKLKYQLCKYTNPLYVITSFCLQYHTVRKEANLGQGYYVVGWQTRDLHNHWHLNENHSSPPLYTARTAGTTSIPTIEFR
jgi:hypothetical protein